MSLQTPITVSDVISQIRSHSLLLPAIQREFVFGSNPEQLPKDDLFDAYDILEVLLGDLSVEHRHPVRHIIEQTRALSGLKESD